MNRMKSAVLGWFGLAWLGSLRFSNSRQAETITSPLAILLARRHNGQSIVITDPLIIDL